MTNVDVTYNAKPGDPIMTDWLGLRFEHGKAVSVPEDHAILKKDDKGNSPVDQNPWFSTEAKRRGRPPKEKDRDPETPEEYFTYAVAWISKEMTAGGMKSRWDNEHVLRQKVGWGSDDEERITKISSPRYEALKKAESERR